MSCPFLLSLSGFATKKEHPKLTCENDACVAHSRSNVMAPCSAL